MRRWTLFLATVALGCSRRATPDATPRASAAPSAVSAPAAASAVPAPGPARSPDRAEHERGVVALLSGATSPEQIPVVAADADETFDPFLFGHLTSGHTRKPPVVTLGTVRGVDQADMAMMFERDKRALLRCYSRGLRANPNLVGRVVVVLSPDADGGTRTGSDSDLPDSRVVRCVVERVAAMPIP